MMFPQLPEIDRLRATPPDITKLREMMQNADGSIRIRPAAAWLSFPWEEVRYFMHVYPIYVLPTSELLFKLSELIDGYKTIEIGAGTGNIGRNLGIRMTDSHLQERKDIKAYYHAMGQPTVWYPKDVWQCDALTAVRSLKPTCVVGCYVTHYSLSGAGSDYGVDFEKLLPKVKRLILVGNKEIHGENPIMRLTHQELKVDGVLSRRKDDTTIFIWDN